MHLDTSELKTYPQKSLFGIFQIFFQLNLPLGIFFQVHNMANLESEIRKYPGVFFPQGCQIVRFKGCLEGLHTFKSLLWWIPCLEKVFKVFFPLVSMEYEALYLGAKDLDSLVQYFWNQAGGEGRYQQVCEKLWKTQPPQSSNRFLSNPIVSSGPEKYHEGVLHTLSDD